MQNRMFGFMQLVYFNRCNNGRVALRLFTLAGLLNLGLAGATNAWAGLTFAQVSAGIRHTCGLTTDGAVWCWGSSGYGIGDGTNSTPFTPVAVVGLTTGVTVIAAGDGHTCAIKSGAVWCWGNNQSGQLGDGTKTSRAIPVAVPSLSSGVTAITAGANHTCALKIGGAMQCWGFNAYGGLGDGTTTDRFTPVAVVGLSSGVTAIATKNQHTCAVQNGGAKCWGYNWFGQLGDNTVTNRLTPVAVVGLSSGVTAITAGLNHTCSLNNGAMLCWGYNQYGQLGNLTTGLTSSTPVAVSGLASGVTAMGAGSSHTCALKTGVWCWGSNQQGQFGNGNTTNSRTPITASGLASGVTAMAVGSNYTCAIKTGGAMLCWGDNQLGQLGNGTRADSPVAVPQAVNAAYILTTSILGSGGSISPGTKVAVAAGAKTAFKLTTVNNGYRASVSGTCGGSLLNGIYTTNSINADCTVIATFTPIASVPITVTNAASAITATSVTLNGTVTSNGATATASFEFGTTTSYGTSLAAGTVNSATPVAVSVNKTGLTCGTTYHYRLKAVNSAGTGLGVDRIVTTTACPAPDFVITSITLTPVSPAVNGTFAAAVIVKNQGTVAGDGKFLDVWANQATAATCGAAGNSRQAVGSLAVNATKTLTFSGLSAGSTGLKTLRAFVDSGCGTVESNEANNQRTKNYIVSNIAVSMTNMDQFSPQTINVVPGAVVKWTNADIDPHTVTADATNVTAGGPSSGSVAAGQSYSWTVPATAVAGTTWYYHCSFHGQAGTGQALGTGMVGAIKVVSAL